MTSVDPNAQIKPNTKLARPRMQLGTYSNNSVHTWGIQAKQAPQRKRNVNSQVKDGENAVAIPKVAKNAEETINAVRRPNVSVINPQNGDARLLATNTEVVIEGTSVLVIFHELHSNAGDKTDNIIISIASDRYITPATIVSST